MYFSHSSFRFSLLCCQPADICHLVRTGATEDTTRLQKSLFRIKDELFTLRKEISRLQGILTRPASDITTQEEHLKRLTADTIDFMLAKLLDELFQNPGAGDRLAVMCELLQTGISAGRQRNVLQPPVGQRRKGWFPCSHSAQGTEVTSLLATTSSADWHEDTDGTARPRSGSWRCVNDVHRSSNQATYIGLMLLTHAACLGETSVVNYLLGSQTTAASPRSQVPSETLFKCQICRASARSLVDFACSMRKEKILLTAYNSAVACLQNASPESLPAMLLWQLRSHKPNEPHITINWANIRLFVGSRVDKAIHYHCPVELHRTPCHVNMTSNAHLTQIPAAILCLEYLQSLDVSHSELYNQPPVLVQLPQSLFKMPRLRRLAADNCKLQSLEHIDAVTPSLRSLSLRRNKLSSLPDVFRCSRLETLDLSKNCFTEVPLCVCFIDSLKNLNLSECFFLEELRPELGLLKGRSCSLCLDAVPAVEDDHRLHEKDFYGIPEELVRQLEEKSTQPVYARKVLVLTDSDDSSSSAFRLADELESRNPEHASVSALTRLTLRSKPTHTQFSLRFINVGDLATCRAFRRVFEDEYTAWMVVCNWKDGDEDETCRRFLIDACNELRMHSSRKLHATVVLRIAGKSLRNEASVQQETNAASLLHDKGRVGEDHVVITVHSLHHGDKGHAEADLDKIHENLQLSVSHSTVRIPRFQVKLLQAVPLLRHQGASLLMREREFIEALRTTLEKHKWTAAEMDSVLTLMNDSQARESFWSLLRLSGEALHVESTGADQPAAVITNVLCFMDALHKCFIQPIQLYSSESNEPYKPIAIVELDNLWEQNAMYFLGLDDSCRDLIPVFLRIASQLGLAYRLPSCPNHMYAPLARLDSVTVPPDQTQVELASHATELDRQMACGDVDSTVSHRLCVLPEGLTPHVPRLFGQMVAHYLDATLSMVDVQAFQTALADEKRLNRRNSTAGGRVQKVLSQHGIALQLQQRCIQVTLASSSSSHRQTLFLRAEVAEAASPWADKPSKLNGPQILLSASDQLVSMGMLLDTVVRLVQELSSGHDNFVEQFLLCPACFRNSCRPCGYRPAVSTYAKITTGPLTDLEQVCCTGCPEDHRINVSTARLLLRDFFCEDFARGEEFPLLPSPHSVTAEEPSGLQNDACSIGTKKCTDPPEDQPDTRSSPIECITWSNKKVRRKRFIVKRNETGRNRSLIANKIDAIRELRLEVGVHRRLAKQLKIRACSNIVQCLAVDCRSRHDLGFLMEDLGDRSLKDVIDKKEFGRLERVRVAAEVCSGLGFLHFCEIAHRDIKPDDVMVLHLDLLCERPMAKIIDFGSACPTDILLLEQPEGKDDYRSPEMKRCSSSPRQYGKQTDVYSFGLVLAEVILRRRLVLPDRDKAVIQFRESTIAEDVRRQSLGLEALCYSMERALTLSPADRPTANTLASHLTQLDSKLMIDVQPLMTNPIDSVAAFRIGGNHAALCMVPSKNASLANLHFATFSADGDFRTEHVSRMLPTRTEQDAPKAAVCCLAAAGHVMFVALETIHKSYRSFGQAKPAYHVEVFHCIRPNPHPADCHFSQPLKEDLYSRPHSITASTTGEHFLVNFEGRITEYSLTDGEISKESDWVSLPKLPALQIIYTSSRGANDQFWAVLPDGRERPQPCGQVMSFTRKKTPGGEHAVKLPVESHGKAIRRLALGADRAVVWGCSREAVVCWELPLSDNDQRMIPEVTNDVIANLHGQKGEYTDICVARGLLFASTTLGSVLLFNRDHTEGTHRINLLGYLQGHCCNVSAILPFKFPDGRQCVLSLGSHWRIQCESGPAFLGPACAENQRQPTQRRTGQYPLQNRCSDLKHRARTFVVMWDVPACSEKLVRQTTSQLHEKVTLAQL